MLSAKTQKTDRLLLHMTYPGPIGSFRSPTTELVNPMAFLRNRKLGWEPASSRRLQSSSTPRSSLRAVTSERLCRSLTPPSRVERNDWNLSIDSRACKVERRLSSAVHGSSVRCVECPVGPFWDSHAMSD